MKMESTVLSASLARAASKSADVYLVGRALVEDLHRLEAHLLRALDRPHQTAC
jgi:hypothetical protein